MFHLLLVIFDSVNCGFWPKNKNNTGIVERGNHVHFFIGCYIRIGGIGSRQLLVNVFQHYSEAGHWAFGKCTFQDYISKSPQTVWTQSNWVISISLHIIL